MKLAAGCISPFRAHGFIESVGGLFASPNSRHGIDAPREKTATHVAEETAAQTPAMILAKQINLVQLPSETRRAAIV
jgi:hypothetical protein